MVRFRWVILLMFFLSLVPTSVFGLADIENKTIIADSDDSEMVLTLEFGENQYNRFGKALPTLQSGALLIGDNIIEIEDARAKIMGNSFVLHAKNFLIYAKGVGNGNYFINSYLIGGSHLEAFSLSSVPQEKIDNDNKNKHIPTEMIVLIRQDIRTFWNDTYDLEIKVFDKKLNPNPQFYQSLGAIDKADINVLIKNIEGKEVTQITGKTNSKGFWEGSYFIKQNNVPGGTYIVEVDVSVLESNNFQILETFFVADSRSKD